MQTFHQFDASDSIRSRTDVVIGIYIVSKTTRNADGPNEKLDAPSSNEVL